MSVLFKALDIHLPPVLRGWNIGTVLVDNIVAHNVPNDFRGVIAVRLCGGKFRTQTGIVSRETDNGRGRCELAA